MIALRRVMSPLVFMSFPEGHGPDLAPESGLDDHHDMHEQKQHEHGGGEEVDGAGGLEAAEQAQQERNAAVIAGDIARPVTTISGAATKTRTSTRISAGGRIAARRGPAESAGAGERPCPARRDAA